MAGLLWLLFISTLTVNMPLACSYPMLGSYHLLVNIQHLRTCIIFFVTWMSHFTDLHSGHLRIAMAVFRAKEISREKNKRSVIKTEQFGEKVVPFFLL